MADRNIRRLPACSRRRDHDGQAVRDHARRRARACQPDRLAGAPSGRSTSTGCRRATTPARPARTSRAGSTTPRSRRLRGRLARAHRGQSAARRHGPGLLSPVRDRLQPRPARRGGRHQLGRALPRRRGDQSAAGSSSRPSPQTGKRVLVVGAGPSGLSAAYHLRALGHDVDDPRRRARAPAA